ncbi:hypothetical protein JG687_00012233, partial [Phytophthora cactorum]
MYFLYALIYLLNLAGIVSMLFEMIETMHWLGKTTRCFFKRVLFNHDTVLVGEIMCAPQCN